MRLVVSTSVMQKQSKFLRLLLHLDLVCWYPLKILHSVTTQNGQSEHSLLWKPQYYITSNFLSGMLKSFCSEGTLSLSDRVEYKDLDMKELCLILLLKLELWNRDEGKYFALLI
jgi:hypothetical protein